MDGLSNALLCATTIQTAHELKPQILRLSPITCCELWYILSELCMEKYAKLRPHFQHGLGNVVLGVSYLEFHHAENYGLHVPFLVKSMQCDYQVLIICHGRPHVSCERNVL